MNRNRPGVTDTGYPPVSRLGGELRIRDGVNPLDIEGSGAAIKLAIKDLKLFNEQIFSRCGLYFRENRLDFVNQRLLERLQKNGLNSFLEYFHLLKYSPAGEKEFTKLLDILTTKETSFFRNKPHFRVLEKEVFPDLIKRRGVNRTLSIWSAGCSTGQEPYSIAMVSREISMKYPGVKIQVLGTDISTKALLKAKKAVYPGRELAAIPRQFKAKYVESEDPEQDTFTLKPQIRDLVAFKYHNLVSQDIDQLFDVIFCRNVVIYFRKNVTAGIMEKFHSLLKEDSYFFIGHSETLNKVYDGFEMVEFEDAVIYRNNKVKGV